MKVLNRKEIYYLLAVFLALWGMLHIVGIFYGSHDIPMHQTHIGDEQSPVNGALHMLQEKNPLGLQNQKVLYYGPVFAVLAVPAVLGDFAWQVIFEGIRSADEYKNSIIWDWGGIVRGLHLTGVLMSILGLFWVFKMFMLKTLNPQKKYSIAFLAVFLLAFNYYFFQTSNFFINWTFVIILLVGQLYYALRLYESSGKDNVAWWAHGVITVTNFGINYINAMYMIAYIPLAYTLWKENREGIRKKLLLYTVFSVVGVLLVILWHPYAFVRLLGMAGIGSMAGHLNSTFTPLHGSVQSSFVYYLKVIVLTQSPLVIALLFLMKDVFVKYFKRNFMWLWMFLSVGVVQLLFFTSLTHHEGRYVLTTVVMLLFLVAGMFAHYLSQENRNKFIMSAVATCFVFYFGFHIVHIGKWLQIYSEGPEEKKMISDVLELQKQTDKPIVLVQNYITGHVHTKEAYQAYITKRGREDVNLYQAIMETPLPEDIEKLNVRYVFIEEYKNDPSLIDGYDIAIMNIVQRPEELNQFHYMDENLLRLWHWEDLMPYYVRIK